MTNVSRLSSDEIEAAGQELADLRVAYRLADEAVDVAVACLKAAEAARYLANENLYRLTWQISGESRVDNDAVKRAAAAIEERLRRVASEVA